MEKEIKIYVTLGCPYCRKMMEWLLKHNVKHTRVIFEDTPSKMQFYAQNPGVSTVPQMFIDGVRIGGWTDLNKHDFMREVEEASGK